MADQSTRVGACGYATSIWTCSRARYFRVCLRDRGRHISCSVNVFPRPPARWNELKQPCYSVL